MIQQEKNNISFGHVDSFTAMYNFLCQNLNLFLLLFIGLWLVSSVRTTPLRLEMTDFNFKHHFEVMPAKKFSVML